MVSAVAPAGSRWQQRRPQYSVALLRVVPAIGQRQPHPQCELRIWADAAFQSLRRSMNNGEVWNLGIGLNFKKRVKIQLYDLDNPGFPLYDDHLGTVIIRPDQQQGSGTFNQDGADYVLDWQ